MNLYATTLSMPVKPFADGVHPNDLYETAVDGEIVTQYTSVATADLNPDFVSLLDDLGLNLHIVELFTKQVNPPRSKNRIHSDGDVGFHDAAKLIWVYGGADSAMRFYEKTEDGVANTESFNNVGSSVTYYKGIEFAAPIPVHTQPTGLSGTLIQKGAPHDIYNPTEIRWAVTVVCRDKETGKSISYEDMYNRLADYID